MHGWRADMRTCRRADMWTCGSVRVYADVQTCGRARICLGATDELSVARERAGDVCAG